MSDIVEKPIHWAEHLFLIGPDPIDPDEPANLWDTLMPARLALIVATIIISRQWAHTGLGEELAAALQYGGLVAVSLATSNWWIVLVVNALAALLWLLLGRVPRDPATRLGRVTQVVVFANRQIGHIELLAVWLTIALVCTQNLNWQLPLAVAVLLLWDPLVSGVGSLRPFRDPERKDQRPRKQDGSLLWSRRPVIYATTFCGQVVVALLAPRQTLKMLPIILAVLLPDVLRFLHHHWRARAARKDDEATRRQREALCRAQRQVGRHADIWLGPGLVAAGLALMVLLSGQARRAWAQGALRALGDAGVPAGRCDATASDMPGEVSVFMIADTQWHELGGRRFAGQRDFADALVPVARRPVELDILSSAPVLHFARLYRELAQKQPGQKLHWTHLGDMADMGCCCELDRVNQALLDRFGPEGFIGVAPGNHDKAFTGNFFWSPFWDQVCESCRDKLPACPSGRLDKLTSDRMLLDRWQKAVSDQGGRMEPLSGGEVYSWFTRRGGALVTVTPLGVVHDHGRPHGLIAVFVDTADERGRDYGIAGEFGTISQAQVEQLLAMIEQVKKEKGDVFVQSPRFLILGHSPMGALTGKSKAQLGRLVAALEADGQRRVLAYVGAHTHRKQATAECMAGRRLPEVIIGSTLDPPQEAALLRIGPDASGALGLRVRALGLMTRETGACGPETSVTARTCTRLLARLQRDEPCCARIFSRKNGLPGPDCQVLESPVPIWERLKAAAQSSVSADEDDILKEQRRRARALFSCLRPSPDCEVSDELMSLNDYQYTALIEEIDRASGDGATLPACLAWAASAVQAHKAHHEMEFADALRCAFDDPTIPGPTDYLIRLEDVPCR
jgi:hypothetical protein